MNEDPHVMAEGYAPTPFTADEIRVGCPRGRIDEIEIREAGKYAYTRLVTFVECDEEGSLQESHMRDMNGTELGEVTRARATWPELQAHASFPRDATRITETTTELPHGHHHCLLYTVTNGQTVSRFWFARDLPGMPVRVERERDGGIVYSMTLVSVRRPEGSRE